MTFELEKIPKMIKNFKKLMILNQLFFSVGQGVHSCFRTNRATGLVSCSCRVRAEKIQLKTGSIVQILSKFCHFRRNWEDLRKIRTFSGIKPNFSFKNVKIDQRFSKFLSFQRKIEL